MLLALAFLVPFAFSQSYLVGVMMPYQWFVYYMTPFLVILAGVSLSFVADVIMNSYFNNRSSWKRIALKVFAVATVCVLVAVMVVRFQTLTGRIGEATVYYSMSDIKAYDAGAWLQKNYPDPSAKAVVMQKPGHWFSFYSGKNVIAETDPVVEWNVQAESVLDLSYEIDNPLTMVRAYEAKTGNISDEFYVMVNMVWKRVTYFAEDYATFSYRDSQDAFHSFALSSLNRTIALNEMHVPKTLTVTYSGEDFKLAENMSMANDTYAVDVVWQLSALNNDLNSPALFLNEYFDPHLQINETYVPNTLNWANPWKNPTHLNESLWATTDFNRTTMDFENRLGFYGAQDQVAVGLRFIDMPEFGNVGALTNSSTGIGDIDAVRFEYQFAKINANSTVSAKYQIVALSMTSYTDLKDYREINTLFDTNVTPTFEVRSRNFASIIRDNYVRFIVYDAERFDPTILRSNWLDLIYSNDKYVVLKIRSDHPYANVVD